MLELEALLVDAGCWLSPLLGARLEAWESSASEQQTRRFRPLAQLVAAKKPERRGACRPRVTPSKYSPGRHSSLPLQLSSPSKAAGPPAPRSATAARYAARPVAHGRREIRKRPRGSRQASRYLSPSSRAHGLTSQPAAPPAARKSPLSACRRLRWPRSRPRHQRWSPSARARPGGRRRVPSGDEGPGIATSSSTGAATQRGCCT